MRMNPLFQRLARDSAKQSEHADVAGADAGYGTQEQDHEQECGDSQADQAKHSATAATTVNHSAVCWVEDRQDYSPEKF